MATAITGSAEDSGMPTGLESKETIPVVISLLSPGPSSARAILLWHHEAPLSLMSVQKVILPNFRKIEVIFLHFNQR